MWAFLNIVAITMGWIGTFNGNDDLTQNTITVGVVIKRRTFEILSFGAPFAFMGRYMVYIRHRISHIFTAT